MREYGPVNVSRHDGSVRIDQAAPRALISGELLEKITEGECAPWATISDDIITFADDYGQRFIYRLGNYNALHDAFEMEWP